MHEFEYFTQFLFIPQRRRSISLRFSPEKKEYFTAFSEGEERVFHCFFPREEKRRRRKSISLRFHRRRKSISLRFQRRKEYLTAFSPKEEKSISPRFFVGEEGVFHCFFHQRRKVFHCFFHRRRKEYFTMLIENAVLPRDVFALVDTYKLNEFECDRIGSEFFKNHCMVRFFEILKENWPLCGYDDSYTCLDALTRRLNMERLQQVEDIYCRQRYNVDEVENCLLDLLLHITLQDQVVRARGNVSN